jgi:hypothetical protein
MILRLAAIAAVLVASLGAAGSPDAAAPDRYIVVLKDSVRDPGAVALDHARLDAARVRFVYRHALKGFAARIPAARLSAVRADSRVAYVVPDGVVRAFTTQANATWGLDRVDQRTLPLSTTFTYSNDGANYDASGNDVKATSSTPASATTTSTSAAARSAAPTPSPPAAPEPTATATARTSPAPSAARPTASPRESRWSPCGCSAAEGPAATPA